jgi:hypothetical protein
LYRTACFSTVIVYSVEIGQEFSLNSPILPLREQTFSSFCVGKVR